MELLKQHTLDLEQDLIVLENLSDKAIESAFTWGLKKEIASLNRSTKTK
jgi:hypothetical protein